MLQREDRSMIWFRKCAPGTPATFRLSPGVCGLRIEDVKAEPVV